jgi:hypothetical protein
MTEYLVLGDGATLPAKLAGKKPDLHLRTVGKNCNLRVQVTRRRLSWSGSAWKSYWRRERLG